MSLLFANRIFYQNLNNKRVLEHCVVQPRMAVCKARLPTFPHTRTQPCIRGSMPNMNIRYGSAVSIRLHGNV